MKEQLIDELCELWDKTPDPTCFRQQLLQRGWWEPPVAEQGGFKDIAIRDDVILKFDSVAGNGHTRAEWILWQRAKPAKRRYLARCYRFHHGLLFQQYVGPKCQRYDECAAAKRIGRLLRILDWAGNHSHHKGRVLFFDYDAQGPGWYSWKRSKRATPIDARAGAR